MSAASDNVEPHRGTLILILAIVALVSGLGCILGPIVWLMANGDLRKMRTGQMDRTGEQATNTGRILGMVATALTVLLFCSTSVALLVATVFYAGAERPRAAPIPPVEQVAPGEPDGTRESEKSPMRAITPDTATTTQGQKLVFPAGGISWADAVISYKPGDPAPTRSRNPNAALGKPDYRGVDDEKDEATYVSLGHGGELVLEFTDNVLVDGEGPDLAIFEIGPEVEPILVAISVDGKTWIDVGQVEGATCTLDIGPFVQPGQRFRFVKLTDAKAGKSNNSDWPGADIDAVGAINTLPVAPTGRTKDR